MKFKYSSFLPPKPYQRWIKRPIVQIEIYGPGGSQKFDALVDSGADCSLFNTQVTEIIGIDLSKAAAVTFMGINGGEGVSALFVESVEMRVNGIDGKVKIPVGFIDNDAVGLLLGQEGFFDKHRIKFEKDHGVFEVTRVI